MLTTTIEVIRAGLKSDPSITPTERARLLALIRNTKELTARPKLEGTERILRRTETARRLSRSVRMVDKLAADGVLRKRTLPGRQRACGFLESDVEALILGRPPEAR
jgi:hypothetical protein